jgi:hypothetical protein
LLDRERVFLAEPKTPTASLAGEAEEFGPYEE